MKLVAVTSLFALTLLMGCETTTKTNVKHATDDQIEVGSRTADYKAAAEKRLALGLGYIERGLLERAKRNLLKAEEYSPDSPDVMFGLAYYYQRVLELNKAESYYKKAINLDPNNPDYLNAYGAFLCTSKKDYQGAVEYFLKAVEKPEYTAVGESYENAGFCTLESQNFEMAGQYFQKAMTFNPRLTRPLYGLALMSFEQGQYNAAESYLLRFEGKSKPTADSLLLGYKIGRRLNDRFSMESYGAKLTQLFPNSEQAIIYRRMNG
ncbi:MAG: type IV pilus biogenesis/stability protein PilW [Gammaproteobacteria bacterium]|nr:type IV pilus biogenesis/stability protein PilW [Gammaproteobacteria bacterium]